MLSDLFTRYNETQRVWEAQFDEDCDKASDSPEWRSYMDASCAIIDYRCADMAEIERRATFMLADSNLVDMLANCSTEAAVRDFLSSMVAPEKNPLCPRPFNSRPDVFLKTHCVAAGECGCGAEPVDKSNSGEN